MNKEQMEKEFADYLVQFRHCITPNNLAFEKMKEMHSRHIKEARQQELSEIERGIWIIMNRQEGLTGEFTKDALKEILEIINHRK